MTCNHSIVTNDCKEIMNISYDYYILLQPYDLQSQYIYY